MKSLKSLITVLILGLLSSVSLVSCLDDDNSNQQLTEEQKQKCVASMSGSYNGNLYFLNKEIDLTKYKNQTDSVENVKVRFHYPASTIDMYDIPAKLFFKQLKNHDDLKAAAEDYGTVDLKLNYTPFNIASNGVISYYMEPQTVSMSLNYGGEVHNIKVAFMLNTTGAWLNKRVELIFVEYAIYDGTDSAGKDVLLDGKALYSTSLSDTDLDDLMFKYQGESK